MKKFSISRAFYGFIMPLFATIKALAVAVYDVATHFIETAFSYFKPIFELFEDLPGWRSLYRLNKETAIKVKQYISEKLATSNLTEDFEHRNFA